MAALHVRRDVGHPRGAGEQRDARDAQHLQAEDHHQDPTDLVQPLLILQQGLAEEAGRRAECGEDHRQTEHEGQALSDDYEAYAAAGCLEFFGGSAGDEAEICRHQRQDARRGARKHAGGQRADEQDRTEAEFHEAIRV